MTCDLASLFLSAGGGGSKLRGGGGAGTLPALGTGGSCGLPRLARRCPGTRCLGGWPRRREPALGCGRCRPSARSSSSSQPSQGAYAHPYVQVAFCCATLLRVVLCWCASDVRNRHLGPTDANTLGLMVECLRRIQGSKQDTSGNAYIYIYIHTYIYIYIYIYMVAPPIDPCFLASTTYSGRIPSASHKKSSLWVQRYITSEPREMISHEML